MALRTSRQYMRKRIRIDYNQVIIILAIILAYTGYNAITQPCGGIRTPTRRIVAYLLWKVFKIYGSAMKICGHDKLHVGHNSDFNFIRALDRDLFSNFYNYVFIINRIYIYILFNMRKKKE